MSGILELLVTSTVILWAVAEISEDRLEVLRQQSALDFGFSQNANLLHLQPVHTSIPCTGSVPNACAPNAVCYLTISKDFFNFHAAYNCSCPQGFTGSPYIEVGNGSCIDTDECTTSDNGSNHVCSDFTATCHNLPGSYKCTCPGGFWYNKQERRCQDTDECRGREAILNGCDTDAECSNVPGSYTCDCSTLDGYYGDGGNCSHPHQCWGKQNPCGKGAICYPDKLTGEAKHCQCPLGFEPQYNPLHCSNIDECQKNMDNCFHPSWADCEDMGGSFQCKCKDNFNTKYGYKLFSGDGITCKFNTRLLCVAAEKMRHFFPDLEGFCQKCFPEDGNFTGILSDESECGEWCRSQPLRTLSKKKVCAVCNLMLWKIQILQGLARPAKCDKVKVPVEECIFPYRPDSVLLKRHRCM